MGPADCCGTGWRDPKLELQTHLLITCLGSQTTWIAMRKENSGCPCITSIRPWTYMLEFNRGFVTHLVGFPLQRSISSSWSQWYPRLQFFDTVLRVSCWRYLRTRQERVWSIWVMRKSTMGSSTLGAFILPTFVCILCHHQCKLAENLQLDDSTLSTWKPVPMPERHQNEHQMRVHNNFCAAFISRFVQLSTLYYKSFECPSCSFFQKSQFQFWFHIYVAIFQKSQFWFWFHTYVAFSSKILVLVTGSIHK